MALIAPRYTPTGNLPSSQPVPQVRAQSGLAEGLNAIGETIASLGKSAQYIQEKVARDEAIAKQAEEAKTRANEVAGTHAALQWKERNEARLAKFYQSRGGNTVKDYSAWQQEFSSDTGDDFKKEMSPEAIASFDRQVSLWRQDFNTKASTHAANQHREFTVLTTTQAQQSYIASAADSLASDNEIQGKQFIASAVAQVMNRQKVTGEPVDLDAIGADAHINALGILAKDNAARAVVMHEKWKAEGAYGKYADDAEKRMVPVRKEVRSRYFAGDISNDPSVKADGNYNIEAAMALVESVSNERNLPPDERERITQLVQQAHNADVEQRKVYSKNVFEDINRRFLSDPNASAVRGLFLVTDEKTGDFSLTEEGARVIARLPEEDRAKFQAKLIAGPETSDAGAKRRISAAMVDDNESVENIRALISKSVLSSADYETFNRQLSERVKNAGSEEHNAMGIAKSIMSDPGGVLDTDMLDKEDKATAQLKAHALADMAVQSVKEKKLPLSRENIQHELTVITAKQRQVVSGILSPDTQDVMAVDWTPQTAPEQMDLDAAKRKYPNASQTQITRLAELERVQRTQRIRERREKAEAIVVPDDADADLFAERIKGAKTQAELERVMDQTDAWFARTRRADPYDRSGYQAFSRQRLDRMLEIKKKQFEP